MYTIKTSQNRCEGNVRITIKERLQRIYDSKKLEKKRSKMYMFIYIYYFLDETRSKMDDRIQEIILIFNGTIDAANIGRKVYWEILTIILVDRLMSKRRIRRL